MTVYNTIFKCNTLIFSGEKAKLTLWGELAHYFNEDVTGKHTVVIVTSTMILSPRFKGNFIFYDMILFF